MSALHKDTDTINNIAVKKLAIHIAKKKLAQTDYKAIKFAEGELTMTEYAPIREERRALRTRINELEAEIKALTE